MTLSELENGDVLHPVSDKNKKPALFVVYGNCRFNPGHGSSTRNCKNKRNELVSRSCRLEVVKTGVSVHAEKIKGMFTNAKK